MGLFRRDDEVELNDWREGGKVSRFFRKIKDACCYNRVTKRLRRA